MLRYVPRVSHLYLGIVVTKYLVYVWVHIPISILQYIIQQFFFIADVGMESLPESPLPLTHLQSLDLGYNNLTYIDTVSIERLSQLRHLSLAGNKLRHLPASCWRFLLFLKTLDISWNPTRVLTKESFVGLNRIQEMTIQNLPDLKRFDADSLSQLTYLKRLFIQVTNE